MKDWDSKGLGDRLAEISQAEHDEKRPGPRIRAVPQTYAGVRFRSTLEADWARTFDAYGMSWAYEPEAFKLSDGQLYRCDFWLSAMRAWVEVKGPHELRLDKPAQLYKDLVCDPDDWRSPLVMVCRVPERDIALVERPDGGPVSLSLCRRCQHHTFIDLSGAWQCRICGLWDKTFNSPDWPEVPVEQRTRGGFVIQRIIRPDVRRGGAA